VEVCNDVFVYISELLEEVIEIIGMVCVMLYVVIFVDDMDWVVRLVDVVFDGIVFNVV